MTNARIYVTCIKSLATELVLKEVLEFGRDDVFKVDVASLYPSIMREHSCL